MTVEEATTLVPVGHPVTFVAQVSDLHIIDPHDNEPLFVPNNERLSKAVAGIASEDPTIHAVLATGDLTNWGRVGQYDALDDLLATLQTPFLPIPGNHDDRDSIRARFPDLPWADAAHASWEVTVNNHVRIIGLDSTNPGESGALFDSEREAWLSDILARTPAAGVQTVLALHHPPFLSEIHWMDRTGFLNLHRLVAVLEGSGISRIFCGHLHRPVQSVVAGIPAQVGLSTVWHVALGLEDKAKIRLINDPAGYQIHRFDGPNSVSHTRYINTTEEPFRPDWAAEYGEDDG